MNINLVSFFPHFCENVFPSANAVSPSSRERSFSVFRATRPNQGSLLDCQFCEGGCRGNSWVAFVLGGHVRLLQAFDSFWIHIRNRLESHCSPLLAVVRKLALKKPIHRPICASSTFFWR